MKTFLMNHTSHTPWASVAMSHGDFTGGGGGDGDGDGDGGGEGDSNLLSDADLDDTDISGLDDEDGISGDTEAFLAKLWSDDAKDDEDEDDEDAGDSPEAQQALRNQIKADIEALQLPEDAIPEEFDPADRKQMRDLLAAVQRNAVQNAMRIMMAPVGAAFKQTIVRMRQEFNEGVSKRFSETEQRAALHAAIPIAKQKEFAKIVDTVMSQSLKRSGGDYQKAITATRKALRAVGISPDGNGSSQGGGTGRNNRPQSAKERTNAVLDMFAPLPQTEDLTKKLANRLRRPGK